MIVAALYISAQLAVPAWVPPFAAEMKAAGMLERYSPPHDRHGLGPTRYEYAVMTYAASDHVMGIAKTISSEDKHPKNIQTWWLKIDRLVDMVCEFSRELDSMGVFAKKSEIELILSLREAQGSLAIADTRDATRVPAWVEPSMEELKKIGLLVGYPDGFHHNRPPTRYEYAVAAHATFMHVSNILSDCLKMESIPRDDLEAIREFSHRIKDLKRLFVEFRRELTAMGVGHTEGGFADLYAELDRLENAYVALAFPFDDVSPGHWAANAIRELSRNGLIRGYPNGTFQGKVDRFGGRPASGP